LIGTTVLHYTITRALGSGGMGVVYEAADARLGRKVALKFLPPELARDTPALERFQREARAASALNHSNICTIYAIENTGGEHGVPFIAMELLDGESLDRRMASRAQSPLNLDTLLDIGLQCADALDAAHQRGIVHRDIKPANIFITREGRAKILDFGVAKMSRPSTAPGAGDAATELAPAAELQLTGPGMAVGTIAYMSPEQARGEEIDARSDLFSLTSVLYEMSTGRPAFQGRTSALVFRQILDGAPEPPAALNPALPQKLEDVILKGLEKDRDLRYQTAAELRGDLKRLKRDASAGKLTAAMPAGTGARPASSGAVLVAEASRRKGLVALALTVFAAILAAAIYGLYAVVTQDSSTATMPPPATLDIRRVTTSGQATGCGSISPDGKTAVYCNFGGELFAVQVATGSSVSLGRLSGATAFSPDGNYVFVSTSTDEFPDGLLVAIPVFGGEPRRILTDITGLAGISPDGTRIAFLRQFPKERRVGLLVADAFGRDVRQLASRSVDEGAFSWPGVTWSPDGDWISVPQDVGGDQFHMRPVIVNAESGEVRALGSETWLLVGRTAWLPGNRLLFSAMERVNGPYQFWIVDLAGGPARRITNETGGFGNASVGVTADGSAIATVPWAITSNLFETNADATTPLVQWTSGVRNEGESIAALARGRVYYESNDGADVGLWSLDSPGGRPHRLIPGTAGGVSTPADGRFVVLHVIEDRQIRIVSVRPDGTGATELTRGTDEYGAVASPDGRWIYFGSKQGLMRMTPEGRARTVIGKGLGYLLDVSPDGRRLLVTVTAAPELQARTGLAIVDAESGVVLTAVDLAHDTLKFGRSAEVLAYLIRDDKGVENLWERPIAGGTPRQLTTFTTGRTFNFAYSHDRRRLFLARGTRTGDLTLIRGFR
jgi:Tol biopolymer transport system component